MSVTRSRKTGRQSASAASKQQREGLSWQLTALGKTTSSWAVHVVVVRVDNRWMMPVQAADRTIAPVVVRLAAAAE